MEYRTDADVRTHAHTGGETLRVLFKGSAVFTSSGRWLHPLFEFDEYLAGNAISPAELKLEDTVIGKAAAVLICRLGIMNVHAGILSRPGMKVLETAGVDFTYGTLVDFIDCQTEELLADIDDFDEIHRLLLTRAGK